MGQFPADFIVELGHLKVSANIIESIGHELECSLYKWANEAVTR